jgi:hypothetical protein
MHGSTRATRLLVPRTRPKTGDLLPTHAAAFLHPCRHFPPLRCHHALPPLYPARHFPSTSPTPTNVASSLDYISMEGAPAADTVRPPPTRRWPPPPTRDSSSLPCSKLDIPMVTIRSTGNRGPLLPAGGGRPEALSHTRAPCRLAGRLGGTKVVESKLVMPDAPPVDAASRPSAPAPSLPPRRSVGT